MKFTNDDITYLLNFFKGREDIFALENHTTERFSRILHDYSDPDRGFILWKTLLEEILH